jgi:hypothetical protein
MKTGKWPEEVDHIDGDTSNNRWNNLRVATHQENLRSTKIRSDNKTGFKGVSLNKNGRFVAQAKVNGKQTYFGLFDTPEEAAEVIRNVREEHYGAFARHE